MEYPAGLLGLFQALAQDFLVTKFGGGAIFGVLGVEGRGSGNRSYAKIFRGIDGRVACLQTMLKLQSGLRSALFCITQRLLTDVPNLNSQPVWQF